MRINSLQIPSACVLFKPQPLVMLFAAATSNLIVSLAAETSSPIQLGGGRYAAALDRLLRDRHHQYLDAAGGGNADGLHY